jgi:hypothetical protein
MEVDMELSKKTTILFSPHMHRQLSRLADQKQTSLGDLVREACERQYRLVSAEGRQAAVNRLARMTLPVDDAHVMRDQAVPRAEEMLP